MRFHFIALIIIMSSMVQPINGQEKTRTLKIGVAGITHGHVSWILEKKSGRPIEVVGIAEPDAELAARYAKRYQYASSMVYTDLEKMLDEVKPEAVVAFGSIYEHLAVVEACAPRGIHVMVEKPLAVSMEHAQRMEMLAKKHSIHLLTNYETSWYPTTEKTISLLNDSLVAGKMRKAVFHHGHEGPKEINVSKEFFNWLTDPKLNGGGAIVDFGCYGANLMTSLTRGEKPVAVMAVTRQFKPAIYPKVDDEATIIVSYPASQAIIQASWNWPFGRKDMEIYGDKGFIIAENNTALRVRSAGKEETKRNITVAETGVYTDPFVYFHDVIRGKIKMKSYGLYTLENNLLVVQILDAARESARTGKKVLFD